MSAVVGRIANRRALDEALARLIDASLLAANGEPVPDHLADEALCRVIASALRRNLMQRRQLGLAGWHARKGENKKLVEELKRHVAEGSMVDVLRCASMLYARAHLYGMES